MENNGMNGIGGLDWSGLIGLLVIAGIFGNGGFGFGGNNARADITNEFLYNQMANDIRANGAAINQVDRDTLENRYTTQLGLQGIQAQQSACCCELKTAIHAEGEATRALIQANTIQDLRDRIADKDREALATGLSYSTSLSVRNAKDEILNSLGNYYPKTGVNPYYVYQGYPYGTTIQ